MKTNRELYNRTPLSETILGKIAKQLSGDILDKPELTGSDRHKIARDFSQVETAFKEQTHYARK